MFLTSSDLPKPDFSGMLDPFDTPVFNKLYRGIRQSVYMQIQNMSHPFCTDLSL